MKDYVFSESRQFEDQAYDLWLLLSQTFYLIAESRDKELNQYGISRQQSHILFYVQLLGDKATLIEISRRTLRKQNSLTEMVNRMEKKGLVIKEKQSVSEGRIIVRLTEKGRQAYYKSTRRESIHDILSVLSDKNRQKLRSFLEILRSKAIEEIALKKSERAEPIPSSSFVSE